MLCSPTLRFGQCRCLCSVADKGVEGTLSDLFNLLLWHILSLSLDHFASVSKNRLKIPKGGSRSDFSTVRRIHMGFCV